MTNAKVKIVIMLLLLATAELQGQQSCYQIGLNEGREIFNEAQRLERSGRCVEAVPQFWEALRRFRLTRNCRDLPANHELDRWEDRCIQGIAACGGKSDESTFLVVSPGALSFTEEGGEQSITVNTNSSTWRVERTPEWCTTRIGSNRLTVICVENGETDGRRENLVIVANTLRYEITIEQAGKTIVEIPDLESIIITEVEILPEPVPADEIIEITEEPETPSVTTPPVYPASPVSPASPASTASSIKAGVGIKVGLNIANISNSTTDIDFLPEMKHDFHAAVFLNLNFGYRENTPGLFGLQPELLYSRQGFAVNGDRINFDYITVPLMIKLYAYEGLNFEFGPWISYLLTVSPDTKAIDGNNIKLSDLKGGKDTGIAVGAGYEFNYGLVINARYLHGLSDMANNLQWTNRVISVSLGWKF